MKEAIRVEVVSVFGSPEAAGNPSGVVLARPPSTEVALELAARLGFPDTVFAWKDDAGWHARFFSPLEELSVCYHALLAAGRVIGESPCSFHLTDQARRRVRRVDRSLTVERSEDDAWWVLTPRSSLVERGNLETPFGPARVIDSGRARAYVLLDHTEPDQLASIGTEPARSSSRRVEPDRSGPRGAEADRSGSRRVEPDRSGPRGAEADRSGSRRAEPDRSGSRGTEPARSSSRRAPEQSVSLGAGPDRFRTVTWPAAEARSWLEANRLSGLVLVATDQPGRRLRRVERVRVRVFTTSLGGSEDVATGGAAAVLPLLLDTDLVLEIEQGVGSFARRGALRVRQDDRTIWVGGATKPLIRGLLSADLGVAHT